MQSDRCPVARAVCSGKSYVKGYTLAFSLEALVISGFFVFEAKDASDEFLS